MSPHLYGVEPEKVDEMMDALAHKINQAQESVAILQAVKACGIVGKVFNAGIVQKIESVLPGYGVGYHIEEYGEMRWRNLIVYKDSQPRLYADDHRFSLANKKETRLTESRINELIEKYRKEIAFLSNLAAKLPEAVTAYNCAAPYIKKMWDIIQSSSIYSGISVYG